MKILKILFPYMGRNEKLKICLILRNEYINNRVISLMIRNYIYYKFHCDISINAIVPKETYFPHPIGIVIGDGVIIGNSVTIYQNVTIGRKNNNISEYPRIEDEVVIYSGSVLAGNITVKKGSIIGANTCIFKDTISKGVYAGNPARLLSTQK